MTAGNCTLVIKDIVNLDIKGDQNDADALCSKLANLFPPSTSSNVVVVVLVVVNGVVVVVLVVIVCFPGPITRCRCRRCLL